MSETEPESESDAESESDPSSDSRSESDSDIEPSGSESELFQPHCSSDKNGRSVRSSGETTTIIWEIHFLGQSGKTLSVINQERERGWEVGS